MPMFMRPFPEQRPSGIPIAAALAETVVDVAVPTVAARIGLHRLILQELDQHAQQQIDLSIC